jgi:ABC-2 type transport system ATP-binding protein
MTTTVHILSTLIGADGGQVYVGGHDVAHDPDAVRATIGVTGQLTAVDNLLTGEENLLLMADLRHLDRREGRRRAAELLDRFDLAAAARKPAATHSRAPTDGRRGAPGLMDGELVSPGSLGFHLSCVKELPDDG